MLIPNNRKISLDRDANSPLYLQLKDIIKEPILTGIYKPGDRLPTEDELCKSYNVSRPVVRQAYDELINEGFIGRKKGSGTFVKERADDNSFFKKIISFSLEETIDTLEGYSKILKLEIITDELVASRLQIKPEDNIFHLVRVLHDSEYPTGMIESYLPYDYFKNIERFALLSIDKPITKIIESMYGIQVNKAKRVIRPVLVDEERRKFLHGDVTDLLYEVETRFIDPFDRVAILEYASFLENKVSLNLVINRK